jgi:3-oxoacyl-[acyl-carrier-protein] synthase II
MEAFIRGTGNISPQYTYNPAFFLEEAVPHNTSRIICMEPDYKEYIKPIQLRRMSRVLKMGVTAAGICLRDAAVETPDAIITATGLGMMDDTEKFLGTLIDNGEKFLNPTSFIQSTHNTVGAYIAVMLKCHHYNFTYVHSSIAFEGALTDCLMRLEDHPSERILLGGIEEITEMHFRITSKAGYWKKEPVESMKLLDYGTPGTITGEGAAFFLLTRKPDPANYARIRDVMTIYKPESMDEVGKKISQFLGRNGLGHADIDFLLLGLNGNSEYDGVYHEVRRNHFPKNSYGYYKHLCGDHYTASSFALWLAAKSLKHQHIPASVILDNKRIENSPVTNILVYNQNKNINHSLMLVSSC